ncbi:MAG: c-type cytochrome [Alphaproteobacteria bacterium]|nr:c-type cytochrome [Alphaproteobacteria bacterium]
MVLAVAALVALVGAPALAAEVPPEMREKLETCAACHGPNGVSPNQEVPSLAAQPELFTQWQLVYMRDGTRKVEAMEAVVKNMSDADVRFYGSYFAALPPPSPEHAKPTDAARGEVLNLMRPRRCANCHDDSMAGKGEMPRLAGQRADYLVKALRDFRSNARRGRGNAVMVELVETLTDNDVKLLAEYLSQLP